MTVFKSLLERALDRYLLYQGRKRLAQVDGLIELQGLSRPVEILRDRWGVPHVYAENLEDLFFAQGFVHGQDRFWQMELHRRLATGRLSEVFGGKYLDIDRAARTLGFARLAQAELDRLDGTAQAILCAYTRGVNAYLEFTGERLPLELFLLNYRPKPWRELDTLAFMRLVLWELSFGWYGEITRSRVEEKIGSQHAGVLEARDAPEHPCTLAEGIEVNQKQAERRWSEAGHPLNRRGLGSNAWAVAGKRTITGMPILCNDMHLPMSAPTLWYENHLAAGNYQVSGVSFPGVPMVIGGHNETIAWGMTAAFTDCEDLFVEKFAAQPTGRYEYQGEWLQAETLAERIRVRGRRKAHVEQVTFTRHGPIISEVFDTGPERVALQSTVLQEGETLRPLYRLNTARNWQDFVEAVQAVKIMQLNILYVDVEGNWGYWLSGTVPIRAAGCGRTPAPGWAGTHEWVGEVPFEAMPHALNPQKGSIVSANNRVLPADYPYDLGSIWVNGYRARRLEDMLENKTGLSPADFRAMQLDVACLPGLEFVERLAGFQSQDPDVCLALELLRAWDGRLSVTTTGGALYEVISYTLMRDLLAAKLGDDLALQVLGVGFDAVFYPASEYLGRASSSLLKMLDEPDLWWFEEAGGRDAALECNIRKSVAWLRQTLGPDVQGWQWGKIHRLSYEHAMGRVKWLRRTFNRGPFPIGGDGDTPLQTAFSPAGPFDNQTATPSMRLIMDAGDWSRSLAQLPMGQSGQPGSRHYDDQVQAFLEGAYHPMAWTRRQVEEALESRLVLAKP